MPLPEHVTAYKDRHGKTRYRFRRAGFVRSLPGEPGHIRFQTAYEEALKLNFASKSTEPNKGNQRHD